MAAPPLPPPRKPRPLLSEDSQTSLEGNSEEKKWQQTFFLTIFLASTAGEEQREDNGSESLAKAKRVLMKVLPQPIRDGYPNNPDLLQQKPEPVNTEQTLGTIGIEAIVNPIELLKISPPDQSDLT